MPYSLDKSKKRLSPSGLYSLFKPLKKALKKVKNLGTRGNRLLQMDFEHQLNALIFFHLEEHTSGRHLLQELEENELARQCIAPPEGIKKSSFFEALNSRGLEQLLEVFLLLQKEASNILPKAHTELGDLVAIDGSLIDAVLSMYWADYQGRVCKKKQKYTSEGQAGVMDRYYQCHKNFDYWQTQGKHFICRIRANTKKEVVQEFKLKPGSIVFYYALVLLGTPCVNQTKQQVRLVGYRVGSKEYWIATNRHDLTAENIAAAYKLRWNIESFLGWWKQHLNVYHLIARSSYGLMTQMLAGLITYLLLAIYCHEQFKERVSIARIKQLRIKIRNEIAVGFQQQDFCDLSHRDDFLAKT